MLSSAFAFYLAMTAAIGDEASPSDIQMAWRQFKMGGYNSAISIFKRLSESAERKGKTDITALYGLACAYDLRQPDPDRAKAAEIYKRIIGLEPGGPLAAWCELALVRQRHTSSTANEPDYVSLGKEYREIYLRHPDEIPGQEAFLFMVAAHMSGFGKEEAKSAHCLNWVARSEFTR
jgi:hypothetical protein